MDAEVELPQTGRGAAVGLENQRLLKRGKYYTCQQESLCVFIQEIGYERRYILRNAQCFVIKLKEDTLDFLKFCFWTVVISNSPHQNKTPTKRWELWQQPGIAMVGTWFYPLILQLCVLFTFWGLILKKKLIKCPNKQSMLYISPQRANEKTLAFFTV